MRDARIAAFFFDEIQVVSGWEIFVRPSAEPRGCHRHAGSGYGGADTPPGKKKSSLRRIVPIINKLNMPIGPAGVICLAEQSLPLTPSTQSSPVAAI